MIEAQHLSKRFEEFTALNRLCCVIPEHSIYGMVGSNGAGKSTFLRLAAGVYRPSGGSVRLDGEPVFEHPAVKERIAYISDDPYFLPGSSLSRMADFFAAGNPRFDRGVYRRLADTFGLDEAKPLQTFSKGMKRQAATLLALSCRADYFFFDETFDGLDPVMRRLVRSLICGEVEDRGVTAVITSHSLRELEDTCDQLALLHKGGIVLQSDVGQLKTSLFKVQIAFPWEFDRSLFGGLEVLRFVKQGSVAQMIVRGDRDAAVEGLRVMQPAVLDVLPLTLEEVFNYEMEALGYSFEEKFRKGGNAQ